MKHFMRAISRDKDNWEAHYYFGLTQQKLGYYDRAIGSFTYSLRCCPTDKIIIAKITCALGQSWENQGYPDRARDNYTKALKLDPANLEAGVSLKRVEAAMAKADMKKEKKNKEKTY